eukprot:TRINITY_DN12230_c0_g1_i1.p1 TRINITY_DN12230_c0_g1~~TRINITY_DN12230_c0_g1_i1.p1  ORF type:complete len:826 (+),score=227.62 TRINITY_DN12230_c0_g1_i1:1606-4083(+)
MCMHSNVFDVLLSEKTSQHVGLSCTSSSLYTLNIRDYIWSVVKMAENEDKSPQDVAAAAPEVQINAPDSSSAESHNAATSEAADQANETSELQADKNIQSEDDDSNKQPEHASNADDGLGDKEEMTIDPVDPDGVTSNPDPADADGLADSNGDAEEEITAETPQGDDTSAEQQDTADSDATIAESSPEPASQSDLDRLRQRLAAMQPFIDGMRVRADAARADAQVTTNVNGEPILEDNAVSQAETAAPSDDNQPHKDGSEEKADNNTDDATPPDVESDDVDLNPPTVENEHATSELPTQSDENHTNDTEGPPEADGKGNPAPTTAPGDQADASAEALNPAQDTELPEDLPRDPIAFVDLYNQLQAQLKADSNHAQSIDGIEDVNITTEEEDKVSTDARHDEQAAIEAEAAEDLSEEDKAIALAKRRVAQLTHQLEQPDVPEEEAAQLKDAAREAEEAVLSLVREKEDRIAAEAAAELERQREKEEAAAQAKAHAARRRELLLQWHAAEQMGETQELQHNLLHTSIAQVLKQKQNKEVSQQTSMAEALQQFNQAMTKLKDLEVNKEKFNQRTEELRTKLEAQREQKEEDVARLEAEFARLRRRTANGSISRQTGMRLRPEQLTKMEEPLSDVQRRLSQYRRMYSKAASALERIQQASEEFDALSGGLNVIDYEQLKVEGQAQEQKIEEKTDEVIKEQKRISTCVQVLSHMNEKLNFLEDELAEGTVKLRTTDAELARKRAELSQLKKARDKLFESNRRMQQELTLLHREDLQRDFEAKQEFKATLEQKRADLNSLQGTLREKTMRLTQRLRPVSDSMRSTAVLEHS